MRFIALHHSPIGQDGKRNLGVVEGNGAAGEDLLFLVAFAGEKNHVAGFGGLERKTNGRGAIDFDGVWDAGGLQSRLDLGQNRRRILGARIVAGGDDKVAAFAAAWPIFGRLVRSRSHQATEDGPGRG